MTFLNARRTTANLLPALPRLAPLLPRPVRVATAFIVEDGGRPNITSKIFATLWYLLVLPDARARLNTQITRKRVPWYALSRLSSLFVSAANIVSMPLSWGLLVAGRRNAARLASLTVLANPPTVQLALLLVAEISGAILNKTGTLAVGSFNVLASPFRMIAAAAGDGDDQQTESESAPTQSTAAPAATTAPATTTTTAAAAPAAPASTSTTSTDPKPPSA